MRFFEVVPFAEAKARLTAALPYICLTETLPLAAGYGRYLANDVFAAENLPAFPKSTVDGFAVQAAATYGASESVPSLLKQIGAVEMGEATRLAIGTGETVYVPTGAMLPAGADSVVMVEHTQKFQDEISIYKSVAYRENVLSIGDDVQQGTSIIRKGSRLKALPIGLLAGLGAARVEVYKKVSFYIISTGDELTDVSHPQEAGRIRDINTHSLAALVLASGHALAGTERVKDDKTAVRDALVRGASLADIVLLSGGSSVGEKDYTYEAIHSFDKNVFFKGVAMKPGKPTVCGTVGGKLAVGLPGHPMAAAIVFLTLVEDAVRAVFGGARIPRYYGRTACNFPSSPGRTTVMPVRCALEADGVAVTPIFGKSGVISPLAAADGYIMIPAEAEGLDRGAVVAVYGFED